MVLQEWLTGLPLSGGYTFDLAWFWVSRFFFRSRLWIISQYSLEHCFFRLGSIFVHPQLRARSVCSVCSACMCGLHGLTGAERGCRRSCLKLKIVKKGGIDYAPGWSNETRAYSDTVLEYLTVFL